MRCLIVDDSAQFVAAARGMLEREGITVVGAASTAVDALRCFEQLRPDVTLVDLDLGGESGFDVAEQLHRAAGSAGSVVILVSTHSAQDFAELIEASPAAGFVAKYSLSGAAIRDLVGHRNHQSAGIQEGDHRYRTSVVVPRLEQL
jgi:DNA-binding NarL/FixJ family response regulator